MNKMLLICFHEIRSTFKRKAFVFFGFGLPILLGVIALVIIFIRRDAGDTTVTATTPPADAVTQGYVDAAGLIETLPADIPAGRLIAYEEEETARAALNEGTIAGYFVIPPDYVSSGDLQYVTTDYSPLGDDIGTNTLGWALLVNLVGDPERAAAVWQPLQLETVSLAPAALEEENWFVELFPTFSVLIIYMTIVIASGALVNAITEEKKNRVLEVLLASASETQFIGGKILALGVIGLLQTLMWVAVLWAVARFGGQPLNIPAGFEVPTGLVIWLFVFGLLGYAMYGSLMAGLGALAPDVKDSRSASFIIILPLLLAYMFMFVTFERADHPVAVFGSLFPLTGPVIMIARMAVSDVPVWQTILSATLQLLTALLIVRLVARMFRAQLLLSGQPFTVRRYFGTMFGRT